MNTSTSTSKSPSLFFLLLFIFSTPFWFIGTVTEHFLPKEIPINLPISALMFVCPIIAALLLTYKKNGSEDVKQLLKRSLDYKKIKGIWYAPILFLMPIILVLEYGLMKLMGVSIPNLQFRVLMVPGFFVVFFISALGEEIGWSGYAIDPLQERWGALGASIIVGVVWAIWHIVPYIQAHNTPIWVAWQCAFTVGNRVLIVWLYNNTGKSVFAAILFHAMYDVCWSLYPNYGSSYDPFITFIIVAVIATIVSFLWQPKTLARYRYARSGCCLSNDI